MTTKHKTYKQVILFKIPCRKMFTCYLKNSRIIWYLRLWWKHLHERQVNLEALTRTLDSMWYSVQNFEVHDLGSNTVLIIFDDEANP